MMGREGEEGKERGEGMGQGKVKSDRGNGQVWRRKWRRKRGMGGKGTIWSTLYSPPPAPTQHTPKNFNPWRR